MSFRSISLKSRYSSINDSIYNDFFNLVLRSSKRYYRIGSNFTSRHFAACAEGLQEFIQNDGEMRLVLMPEFKEEDIDQINSGVRNPADILSERWIQDYSEIKEKFVEDHTKALAWMLANKTLEIKTVIPMHSDGSIMPYEKLYNTQIFKQKAGIFWDNSNDIISFSGSIDFDDEVLGEYYDFRVYRGWDHSERKFVDIDFETFEKYWNGHTVESGIELKSIPLPDAICENLIKIAPKSKSEIRIASMPRLRPYQKEAVARWAEHGNRGIFEMATGTGKTFTAIGCIGKVKEDCKMLVVIACPFDNLERQWKRELEKWGLASMITSDGTDWDRKIGDGIASMKEGIIDTFVVITTYRTFSGDRFLKTIESSGVTNMLIADEVHNAGASSYMRGLSDAYQYRLGLSATFKRYFDSQGTDVLKEYFDGTVYAMKLKEAIEQGFLVGYYYHPIYANLNKDEYNKYRARTRTIARLWNSKKKEDRERLEMELMKRSQIIRDASEKIVQFKEWLEDIPRDSKYILVYCSENQIGDVKKYLDDQEMINHEITAKIPKNPKMRTEIIKKFEDGQYNAIVANRVLDEGADIPAAKSCILLASTGNPKQFIQRRGRVLRQFGGVYKDKSEKKHATIYDILVMPDISADYTDSEMNIERRIVASQIERQEEMAQIAINSESCMKEINGLKEKFSIE